MKDILKIKSVVNIARMYVSRNDTVTQSGPW